MATFTERMIRASKLDPLIYEEVEADHTAMKQAVTVVILSSLAAGIGAIGTLGFQGLIMGLILALAGWFIWAYLTFFIGTKLLPEPQTHADHGELLRTIGFSSSPGILRVFAIIPFLAGLINIIAAVWMLAAMIVAVRQALDYTSTLRAVGVTIIGWLVQMVFLGILMAMF